MNPVADLPSIVIACISAKQHGKRSQFNNSGAAVCLKTMNIESQVRSHHLI